MEQRIVCFLVDLILSFFSVWSNKEQDRYRSTKSTIPSILKQNDTHPELHPDGEKADSLLLCNTTQKSAAFFH